MAEAKFGRGCLSLKSQTRSVDLCCRAGETLLVFGVCVLCGRGSVTPLVVQRHWRLLIGDRIVLARCAIRVLTGLRSARRGSSPSPSRTPLASACLPPEAGPTSLAVQQGLVESPLRAADRAAELPSTTGQRIASDIDDQLPHASLTLPQLPTLTRTLRGWLDEMLMSACSARTAATS